MCKNIKGERGNSNGPAAVFSILQTQIYLDLCFYSSPAINISNLILTGWLFGGKP